MNPLAPLPTTDVKMKKVVALLELMNARAILAFLPFTRNGESAVNPKVFYDEKPPHHPGFSPLFTSPPCIYVRAGGPGD